MSVTNNSRPRLACEVMPDRVVAARATGAGDGVESYGGRSLAAGVVAPSLAAENIGDRGTLARAISEAIALVGARSRDVTAILPDAAVRLMILDFDNLPERAAEALPLVRFRLKKLLPFDSERAAVTYQALRASAGVRAVVAVAHQDVVAEYEGAFRDAGFNPGVVLPSIAAALGAIDGASPTLIIKGDPVTTTVAILDQNELRLVRTLEVGNMSPQQLAEEIHPLLVFFEDQYGRRIEHIRVGGAIGAEEFRGALASPLQARVSDLLNGTTLESSASVGGVPRGSLAGVTGALLG